MNKSIVIKWIVAAITRGTAWGLAGWLGMEATQAGETSGQIGNAVAALILAGLSIYTSLKGRKKLLETPVK